MTDNSSSTASSTRTRPLPLATSNSAYATILAWCRLSGMGRSASYEALGRGDLRAIKLGTRTLIDVPHGLAWLATLPAASVRLHGAGRRKQTV